jgi:hypothetical protein
MYTSVSYVSIVQACENICVLSVIWLSGSAVRRKVVHVSLVGCSNFIEPRNYSTGSENKQHMNR